MNKRVTGIGGVFICSPDPKRLQNWYRDHLGIEILDYGGSMFRWSDNPNGTTTWSVFRQGNDYMKPAENKTFMINYRVENLVELLKRLGEEGVERVGEIEEYSYGKFGWVLDCDGNKVELWEPIDSEL